MPDFAGPAPPGSTYLEVAFGEKDSAKRLGARWDKAARKWYVPPSLTAQLKDFKAWLPGAKEEAQEYRDARPDRVYLSVSRRQGFEARGAVWDPDCPPNGSLYVPAELTGNLAQFWSDWGGVPEDVHAGGAAAAAADADVDDVNVPETGLPAHTFKWVYFKTKDGALMRRARRWHSSGAELLTQWEYNRRVRSQAWPRYLMDDQIDYNDSVPEWHGGGEPDIPKFEIDRRKPRRGGYGHYDDFETRSLYVRDAASVEKKRGQYQDVDEVVRAAPGAAEAAGKENGRAGRAKKRKAAN